MNPRHWRGRVALLLPCVASAALACPPGDAVRSAPFALSFDGRRPAYENGTLHVDKGVDPGVPVLFEPAEPGAWRLRPARADEHSDGTRAVYRFDWQDDGSARMHELIDPAVVARLRDANARDTASPAGQAFEDAALTVLLQKDSVFHDCVGQRAAPDAVDLFFEVDAQGRTHVAAALPEGTMTECLAKGLEGAQVDPPPTAPFTAAEHITITP